VGQDSLTLLESLRSNKGTLNPLPFCIVKSHPSLVDVYLHEDDVVMIVENIVHASDCF